MTSMNKPLQGDTNWYQALTDNWTSIENNLIDKGTLAAKGDLLVATAASTPGRVAVGTDGQTLQADSTQTPGVKWGTPSLTTQDQIDNLWGKQFFVDEGFLPSTKIFEYVGTPPAFAGTVGAATWTRDPGAMKPSASGLGWYDLGAAKSRILFVIGNLAPLNINNIGVHFTPNAPTGLDPDGFSIWNTTDGHGVTIEKHVSGVYTILGSLYISAWHDWILPGCAFYYDDATDTLKLFLRTAGQWFFAASATSTAFTTLRYIGFQAPAANPRWVTPYVCYAQ